MKERISVGIAGFNPRGITEINTDLINIKAVDVTIDPKGDKHGLRITLEPVWFNKECLLELADTKARLSSSRGQNIYVSTCFNLKSASNRIKSFSDDEVKGFTYEELTKQHKLEDFNSGEIVGLGVPLHKENDYYWSTPNTVKMYFEDTATLLDALDITLDYLTTEKSIALENSFDEQD